MHFDLLAPPCDQFTGKESISSWSLMARNSHPEPLESFTAMISLYTLRKLISSVFHSETEAVAPLRSSRHPHLSAGGGGPIQPWR